jgi:diketogulonate reductase-like aldo/keto reductase
MEFREFGPTKHEVNLERGDRAAAIAALRLGIDLGMRHIDTAEMYGGVSSNRWSPRRSPGAARKSSSSPRSFVL